MGRVCIQRAEIVRAFDVKTRRSDDHEASRPLRQYEREERTPKTER